MAGETTDSRAGGARRRRALVLALSIALQATGAGADAGTDAGARDAATRPPGAPDAGKPRRTRVQAVTELLYSTTEAGRMHARCSEPPKPDAPAAGDEAEPEETLRCAFFTVIVSQRPSEKMATFGNYGEILRDMASQCRTLRTRTEQARKACAACRKSLTAECLYVQVMHDLRKRCTNATPPAPHPNPAVRALEQADTERGQSATAITERFCAACRDDPSAACFSGFWNGITPPLRCALKTASFELTLARQRESDTWIGNLGGSCNTQIALSYDEPARTWTYRQVQLTPEKCSAVRRDEPIIYTSAPSYAFSDLTVMCERMAFQ